MISSQNNVRKYRTKGHEQVSSLPENIMNKKSSFVDHQAGECAASRTRFQSTDAIFNYFWVD